MTRRLFPILLFSIMAIVSCQDPVSQAQALPVATSHAVSFNANGGSGSMLDQTITDNTSAGLTANSFTRTGYTFAGWNSLANGSGSSYAAGASFTMGTAAVTLYAQWTALPTFGVSYDGNINTDGAVPIGGSYLSGALVTVPRNSGGLVKSGYVFAGWNSQANGSGTDYPAGTTFTMGSAAVTLYAQWTSSTGNGVTVVDPPKIAVTLTGQSSTLAQDNSMTVSATSSDKPDSFAWYLDGYLIQQGRDKCTVGPSLSLGAHSLVAIIGKSDALFSASCLFTVH
ncbi:MAG: InlB B-repeat-containing protein [Spirochaetota bacterium]